jgi:predicted ferric reductase
MKFDRITWVFFGIMFITFLLWAFEHSFEFKIEAFMEYFAQIAALTAIMCMSIDYITSTRLKIIEDIADGLDIVYRFHGYIGKIAGVFVIGHPIFLMLTNFQGLPTVQRFFLPGNIEFFNWGILSFWILLLLIALTVFIKLEYRLWKNLHRFMIIAFAFGAYHTFLDYTNATRSTGLTAKEIWVLSFIVLGLISFIYRDFIYPFLGKKFRVLKVNTINLVTEIYLEPLDGKSLKSKAGQFVFFSVENNPLLSKEAHPFGITSSPTDKIVRISAKHLGDYTKKLGNLKEGNIVKLWGPYGRFTWERFDKYKKQVWIAGGIGIAPFLSKAKYAIETKSNKDISLFYVEKNETECEYNPELRQLLKDQDTIKFYNHCDDASGYLTAKEIQKEIGDLSDTMILMCGPMGMVSNLERQFAELGLPDDMTREESFLFK